MKFFNIEDFEFENAKITKADDYSLITYSKKGGRVMSDTLFKNINSDDKFLCFDIENMIDRSQNILFEFWTNSEEPVFSMRMGLLPHLRTTLSIPFEAFDAKLVFIPRTPGRLKTVVTGNKLNINDITKFSITLKISILKEDVIEKSFKIYNIYSTSTEPDYTLNSKPIVDEFGQWNERDWKGKIHNLQELKESHNITFENSFGDRSKYGGWLKKRFEATGFFRVQKDEKGKTWLVDPDGYVFISNGAAETFCRIPCRTNGIESLFEKLPPDNKQFRYSVFNPSHPVASGEYADFLKHNLYLIYGENWYEEWQKHTASRLKHLGLNSAGNWSDINFCRTMKIPYVLPMEKFPKTSANIFRDFPDVFSDEYHENSKKFAEQLIPFKDDSYLIGYFMSNEPLWTWTPNLNLVEEMYTNDKPFKTRKVFSDYLKNKYSSIDSLNSSWGSHFNNFDDFCETINNITSYNNEDDLKDFTKIMMDEYIKVPALAIKEIAPHHLNLGQRYAAPIPDRMLAGSDYIDVLSFNCYQTSAVNPLRELGKYTDKPCMIGEFHFGAFDRGMSMTGIVSVENQKERGNAYRYYMEMSAKEPNFVGANYYTLYDQAYLGRFDGENYQIGICDVCDNEYEEFAAVIRETSKVLYEVADGQKEPFSKEAKLIAR